MVHYQVNPSKTNKPLAEIPLKGLRHCQKDGFIRALAKPDLQRAVT